MADQQPLANPNNPNPGDIGFGSPRRPIAGSTKFALNLARQNGPFSSPRPDDKSPQLVDPGGLPVSQASVDSGHDIHRDCDSVVELLLDGDIDEAVSVHRQCLDYYGYSRVNTLLLLKVSRRAAEARSLGELRLVRNLHEAANDRLSLAPSDVVRQVFATAGALAV